MKKILVLLATAIMATACQQSIEDKAKQEAILYTKKNCPARIDNNLILDSMTYEEDSRTLHYYYRLTGIADSIMLPDKDVLRKALLKELQNTTSIMAYKEAGFNFAYTYRSENNPDSLLFDTSFTKKDYQ